jgi:ABC-2 type transport system permease protein
MTDLASASSAAAPRSLASESADAPARADSIAARGTTLAPLWLAAFALWKREIVRFYRQPSRVIGAISSPLLFWALIGSGMSGSFQAGGADAGVPYLEFFFPGVAALVVLFTAIMSMASVIEDRDAGFLQGALAAPAPRASIALGKILGGMTLAVAQGALFLFAAPLAGFSLGVGSVLAILGALALLGFALSGLGFLLAWSLESFQGFHVIMNLLLMPMWMLSGAPFPASGAAGWIRGMMAVNPMTYGVEALRQAFYVGAETAGPAPLWGMSPVVTVGATALFGAAIFVIATWRVGQRSG